MPTYFKTLEAKCYCGSIHFTINVPESVLPFPVYLCHCSLCRFRTGAPCVFQITLPKGLRPSFIAPSTEQNLARYSIKGASCTYDFCSTCGCHIASVALDRQQWTLLTSIFTDHGPRNFQIDTHVFSKSAKDGGLAQYLTHVGGRELADWNPPDSDPRSKIVESKPEVGKDGEDRLRAKCHCGGVSFTIKRPTKKMLDDDLIGSFISPIDTKKWTGSFDVCDDCRLVNGTHVIGWTFVPLSVCEPKIKPDLKIGTAKTYVSSPGILRSFCGTCGATVFYSRADRNPSEERQVVDLATGILRAPEGVMAENWLTWRPQLIWIDDGKYFDKEFCSGLEAGIREHSDIVEVCAN